MKITFLSPHLKVAGGIRTILTYADLLSKRGHIVRVVVPGGNLLRRIAANSLNIKPAWSRSLEARIVKVRDFGEKNIPSGDIVVASSWSSALETDKYGPQVGKKFYLIQHYESLYHGPTEEVDKTYRLPLKKIVISSWLRGILKEKFGQDAELMVTPVDTGMFKPIEGQKDGKYPRVLLMHHTANWKGTAVGLEVFNRVKVKYSNLRLIMFGVRNKQKPAGCDEYFYDLDQKDLAKLYSSCDIYLCPSEYEGLGMPGMEAMACKCALVTFDTGGSRDYAINGQTAFVAEHNNADDLANKLELAVSNAELRHKIAENGYHFITSQFSWEKAVDKIEEIFKSA